MPSPRWQALVVRRGVVAHVCMAHALVRLVNGSVLPFGAFLERAGLPHGVTRVRAISAIEIVAGSLPAIGVQVRWSCAALAGIVVVGIMLIRAHNGGFVGERGAGGIEYSVLLAVLSLLGRRRAEGDAKAPGRSDHPAAATGPPE